jgi:hypothetical protein
MKWIKSIYKLTPFRPEFLSNRLLRITPREDLNDPYDFYPFQSDIESMEFAHKAFGNGAPIPETQEIIDNHLRNIGVISFTEAIDNILMWSHYADAHRGMAIGFNPKHLFFNDIQRMRYTTQRTNLREEFQNIKGTELFFKSDQWIYEKEWRLTKFFSEASHAYGLTQKNIQDIKSKNYFQIAFRFSMSREFSDKFNEDESVFAMLEVPADAIQSFIFGERVTKEQIEEFISALKKEEDLSHVVCKKIVLNPDKYELEFQDIK